MLGSSKGTKTKLLEIFFSGTTCQRCIDLLEWHTSLAQASCALEGVLPISSAHIYPKLDTGSTHTGRDLLPFSFAIACSNSTECLWPHWLCTEWLSESMRLCRNTDFPFPLHVCERDSTGSTCLGKKKMGLQHIWFHRQTNFTCSCDRVERFYFLWHYYQL